LKAARFLKAVDELRDAATAKREPVGELAHSRTASWAALDRLQDFEPAERRQVSGDQCSLDALSHGGVAGGYRAPSVKPRSGPAHNSQNNIQENS
jgi:hypothetical protein